MTEIITWTISDPEVLKAKGVEVLYRCKDCDYYKPCEHPQVIGPICHRQSEEGEYNGKIMIVHPYFTRPMDYCSSAIPRK